MKPRILERLPDREEKLIMANALRRRSAVAGQLVEGLIRIAVEQLSRRAGKPNVGWRVDAIRDVGADRPYGSSIANPKSDGVDHVIEILRIVLMEAERKRAETGINIAHVMKDHALNILTEKRKTQLDIIDEERIAAQRETGSFR